jgi:hypothetical protein
MVLPPVWFIGLLAFLGGYRNFGLFYRINFLYLLHRVG